MMWQFWLCGAVALSLVGCGSGGSGSTPTSVSETPSESVSGDTGDTGDTGGATEPDGSGTDAADADAGLTASVRCDEVRSVTNTQASLTYTSEARWSCESGLRQLSANGIPDHVVGEFPNAANPNAISEQRVEVNMPLNPSESDGNTELGGPRGPVGYVLNGVKIDAATAGSCSNSGSCSLIGNSGSWEIEALGQTVFDFGTDASNAHVQPDGAYHYHGMPEGFLDRVGAGADHMTLIGWAVDGFPIYARYGYSEPLNADSAIRVIRGSYALVAEAAAGRPDVALYPLGTFAQDWVYAAGSGDLDACNGRFGVTPEFPDGIYHYYATDTYPYFQRCVGGAL